MFQVVWRYVVSAKSLYQEIWEHVVSAVLILLLGLTIPMAVLILYLDVSPPLFAQINGKGKLAEVILIILPLTSLYLAICAIFLWRTQNERHTVSLKVGSRPSSGMFFCFFVVPFVVLILAQPFLFRYLFWIHKHSPWPPEEVNAATWLYFGCIGCLLLLELTMSITLALKDAPLRRGTRRFPRQGVSRE